MSQQEIVGSILEVVDELKHKITDGEYLKICAGLQKLVLKGEEQVNPYSEIINLVRYRRRSIEPSYDDHMCLVRMRNGKLCTNPSSIITGKCGVHKKDKFIKVSIEEYHMSNNNVNVE
jgi:hypothetical protein